MRTAFPIVLLFAAVLPGQSRMGGMHGFGGAGRAGPGVSFGGHRGIGFRPGFPSFHGGFRVSPFRSYYGGLYGYSGYYGLGYGFGLPWSSYYAGPYSTFAGYPYSSYDAYGAYPYGQSYAATPQVTIVMMGPPESPRFAAPPAEPQPPPRPPEPPRPESAVQPSPGPILYILAMKDGTLWAAVAYWTEGSTLHFVTRAHERRQVPLDRVDRELSEQLNRERRVDFRLPPSTPAAGAPHRAN